jgi:hypothetical protein
MNIGKIIMDNLISIGIATIIVAPFCAYLYSVVKKYVASKKVAIMKQLELVNDPEIRKLVEGIIVEVEIAMGSEAGREKFNKAKQLILNQIPDLFDPYVDKLLQGVYDGMVEKGDKIV